MYNLNDPAPRMTAGQFLWYVTKVIVVVSVLLVGLGYALNAQGLTDDQPCKTTFAKSQYSATMAVKELEGVMVTTMDPSMVQPIMKEAVEGGITILNPETINEMFVVQLPDGQTVIGLGANGCSVGFMTISGDDWKSLMQKLSGEAL